MESNFYLIVYNKCPHFKKVMHIICELQPCPVYTYNPETIHRNFRVKISDAVFPPLSGVWVREVRKGCWAWPNLRIQNMTTPHFQIKKKCYIHIAPHPPTPTLSHLPYQDLPCSVFDKDISFKPIIKGRVRSWGAAAAYPWVL